MPAPPLASIRVLEVGNYMAGPFCAMQLADLGADVVKVESPAAGGDEVRKTAPFLGAERESSNFVRLNRNKRSLALDLRILSRTPAMVLSGGGLYKGRRGGWEGEL